jgi:hypothetical protein
LFILRYLNRLTLLLSTLVINYHEMRICLSRSLGFAVSVFFFLTEAHSQNIKCGWLQKPTLPQKNVVQQKLFENYLQQLRTTDADSLFTLPVVVHVIHTGSPIGSADNPTDASIQAMIVNLNNSWRKNGTIYGGADMRIQFQLALKSPACVTTPGINRIDGRVLANYASGGITNYGYPGSVPEELVKNLSRWPNADYINIWIVNKIDGNSTAPGGYAYFPEYNSAITDGIVLQASVVDGSNKTIVHEMGHTFSLYHTFYDGASETTCAANGSCALQGDMICDTEPHLAAFDCSATVNSCTSNPFIVTDVPHNYTVQNNYMSYTNCQWMFTADQKARVRAALFAWRNGLISSGGLTVSSIASPAAACIPTATHGLSPYYGVQRFDFNNLHVYSNSSEADGALYVDRTCNQKTTVVKGQSYPLTVTGSYENPHRIKVFIDYNNDGDFNDADENVLSDYNGIATTNVVIPLTGVVINTSLRLRVVADNPALPEPTECTLNGTTAEGAGQVEDFAVIIERRKVYSISSGAWNNPPTWSCNCVPGGDDEVTIKAAHTITITPAMGLLQCGKLELEAGSVFNVSGNGFKVVGND